MLRQLYWMVWLQSNDGRCNLSEHTNNLSEHKYSNVDYSQFINKIYFKIICKRIT